jgi:hypothetical protein
MGEAADEAEARLMIARQQGRASVTWNVCALRYRWTVVLDEGKTSHREVVALGSHLYCHPGLFQSLNRATVSTSPVRSSRSRTSLTVPTTLISGS